MFDSSLVSLKIPWLQASERLAPCSQLVAKTKKTPFYGPLTSGFAVHCVYSGLPISHGNRPNVPKPMRKNNFRRVQLLSAPLKPAQNRRFEPSVLHRAGHQSSRVIKCSWYCACWLRSFVWKICKWIKKSSILPQDRDKSECLCPARFFTK